jgi:hypothetical protein
MKISCCLIWAGRASLIGPRYVLSEVVMRYLSIAQHASVREREPQFVLQVQPCGQTVLKSGLKWSMTWWRGATFCRRRSVYLWVLTEGIDRFSIAMPDHVDSSGFIVRISLRANPKDWVVIDGVSIGGRARLSIGFVVTSYLTTTWSVLAEFLRPQGNSM